MIFIQNCSLDKKHSIGYAKRIAASCVAILLVSVALLASSCAGQADKTEPSSVEYSNVFLVVERHSLEKQFVSARTSVVANPEHSVPIHFSYSDKSKIYASDMEKKLEISEGDMLKVTYAKADLNVYPITLSEVASIEILKR